MFISSLPLTIFLFPMFGLLTVLAFNNLKFIKFTAAVVSFISLLLSMLAWILIHKNVYGAQLLNSYDIWGSKSVVDLFIFFPASFVLGVDILSCLFLILSNFIIFLVCMWSWTELTDIKIKYSMYLILLFILNAAFLVYDIFFFYIFFEMTLLPMVFLIGVFGPNRRRIKAVFFFFIYTFFGSIFLLVGILLYKLELSLGFPTMSVYMYSTCDCCSFSTISVYKQLIIWPLFFIGFAVKIPVFPVHLWLPEAHVEAPTTGSVVLAALLLKLGGFGLLRYTFVVMPWASSYYSNLVYMLCAAGSVYAPMIALRQIDLKKILAYSSVSHMNMAVASLFSLTTTGLVGFVTQMLAHGLTSAIGFFVVGLLYDRFATKQIFYFGGLALVMPLTAVIFFFNTLANVALPGTFSFVGEFIIIYSLAKNGFSVFFFLIIVGLFINTVFNFWIFTRLFFGNIKDGGYNQDLTIREACILAILTSLSLLLGLFPNVILGSYSSVFYNFTILLLV